MSWLVDAELLSKSHVQLLFIWVLLDVDYRTTQQRSQRGTSRCTISRIYTNGLACHTGRFRGHKSYRRRNFLQELFPPHHVVFA